MKRLKSLFYSSPLFFILGCGSVGVVTYKTLATVGAAENAAMVSAATMYVNNTISSNSWNTISADHAKFLVAYDTACLGAAVALDQATVPTNVLALETVVLQDVATFIPSNTK